MAANEKFIKNAIAKSIFDYYIEDSGLKKVILPPYYSQNMLDVILEAKNDGLNIIDMTGKEWQNRLLNRNLFEQFNQYIQTWERK